MPLIADGEILFFSILVYKNFRLYSNKINIMGIYEFMKAINIILFPPHPLILSVPQAFSATGCFRIVLVMPDDKIAEACTRIKDFCREHYKA